MSIANNKKAFHDFFIEDQLEAGLVLEGWEVKANRHSVCIVCVPAISV